MAGLSSRASDCVEFEGAPLQPVPSILEVDVGSSWEKAHDRRPLRPELRADVQQQSVFVESPGPKRDSGREVVLPSVTDLARCPLREGTRNHIPLFRAVLVDELADQVVFFRCELPFRPFVVRTWPINGRKVHLGQ